MLVEKFYHTHDSKGNFMIVREQQFCFWDGIYSDISTDIIYIEKEGEK